MLLGDKLLVVRNNYIFMKKLSMEEVKERLQAFFSHMRKLVFKVSTQNLCHHYCLIKFPIVFQPIIIQNYDDMCNL